MSNKVCPVLLAGVLKSESNLEKTRQKAKCIGEACAWWDDKYGMCFIEMIAFR